MVSDLFLRSFLIHSLGYTSDLCWEEYYNCFHSFVKYVCITFHVWEATRGAVGSAAVSPTATALLELQSSQGDEITT